MQMLKISDSLHITLKKLQRDFHLKNQGNLLYKSPSLGKIIEDSLVQTQPEAVEFGKIYIKNTEK